RGAPDRGVQRRGHRCTRVARRAVVDRRQGAQAHRRGARATFRGIPGRRPVAMVDSRAVDRERYYEISRQASRLNAFGATAIWLAMAAAVWGKGADVVVVLVAQTITVAVNVWVNHRVLDRVGPWIEIVRAVFNAVMVTGTAHLVGWPEPAWLWPPF